MSYDRINAPKVSDSIVTQLEEFILLGILKPGDRLPAERVLAKQFDVSRSSLRDALVKLEARGLIQTHRGGGNFVCDLVGPTLTDPLVHLLKDHPEAMLDLLEVRQALEEIAVQHAAERATELDLEILRKRFKDLEEASAEMDIARTADQIAEFYVAISDASHNVALMHTIRGLFNLMRTSVMRSLDLIYGDPAAYSAIHRYRRAMFEAICERQPEKARQQAHSLVRFVNRVLREANEDSTVSMANADAAGPAASVDPSEQEEHRSRLSDGVIEDIIGLIRSGALKPGNRLEGEQELAQRFGVSRVVVREAIVQLEARGVLNIRRGGGIYVCASPGPTINDPLVHLLESYPETIFDFLELRRSLEELATQLAAARATDEDLSAITREYEALKQVYEDPDPYRDADIDAGFHLSLAEASRNIALVCVMHGLFNLLRVNIRRNLERLNAEPGSYEVLRRHHRDMYEAVINRDPEAARKAAHVHITFVDQSLRQLGLEKRRLERAKRRLESLPDMGEGPSRPDSDADREN